MITALEIENFKGFGERQRIEFGPLTLLFGANSAGKSTILQALVYLHELLKTGNADVDRAEIGGESMELGGFARLVHKRELSRAIVLRAEFTTPRSLDRFERNIPDFPFPDLDDEFTEAFVEVTVRYHRTETFQGPLLEQVLIGRVGDASPLLRLTTEPRVIVRGNLYIAIEVRINFDGPLAAASGEQFRADWREFADWSREAPDWTIIKRNRVSALPPLDEPLDVNFHEAMYVDNEETDPGSIARPRALLEMLIIGTTAQLRDALKETLYVGPLRAIPPRGFLVEQTGRAASWSSGLRAWDLLLADRTSLVERTNDWLKRLGASCSVVIQQLYDVKSSAEALTDGHVDQTVRRLLLDTGTGSLVLPSEVGAGIAQILPVIVAALAQHGGLAMIEQPEIHLHPAMQVGLGDLFIEAVTREAGRRLLLIETHSEHLILRILRRIRETTEGALPDGAPAFNVFQLSVLYIESGEGGARVRSLRVDQEGEFVDRWPKGFFAERMGEL